MAAEAILANGVNEILKGLRILVASEIALAWGVENELQSLKKTLDMILTVIDDAEKKQMKNKDVRLWLEELKDIAYEADDILDKRAYDVLRQHVMPRKRDKVSNFFSLSNPIKFRHGIAHEIKQINENLKECATRKQILGLEKLELARSSSPMDLDESNELRKLRETDSIVDSSFKINIGRDKDKLNIINMLLHKNSQNQDGNIQVIPIVGMGGVGKTTLTQWIFDDETVKNHFHLKLWVCVSDEFNVKKLFVKIIESIIDGKYEEVSNIDVIARRLQQHLSGKKYLLVLDDVWNKKQGEWERLKKPLLMGDSESKILVTTRSEEVASIVGDGIHSYKLGILDEGESWSFFHERTFGHGTVETPTLTTIGKELVEKCKGLPLALVFLTSLLRNKKDANEWRDINENKIWVQSNDETRILPILKLSYDHLPSHLKQCFSYFSLFMKDTVMNRKTMILMWMAEGFLPQPSRGNNKSMEKIGNEYFNSLLHNSFFQDMVKDTYGQVQCFKMHDLVHDLATYVAGDRECLISRTDEDVKSILTVRRLRLLDESEGISFDDTMAAFDNKSKLRTLFLSNESIKKMSKNVFDNTKRLRVLDLHDASNIEEIPSSLMDKQKHLRYLDLSDTKIINLPKSVTRLFHLQTLKLDGCENLKELPQGIGKLISLRHLFLPEDIGTLPREIGQLTCLQTLQPYTVANYDNQGSGIEVLEGLNLLNGEITIKNLRNETDAKRANLGSKVNLKRITLNWHSNDSDVPGKDEAVLEALQPHSNLKMLVIDQYFGGKIPQWMGDPSCLPYLTNLQLSHCTKCEQLVGFGKLPSLKVLRLRDMDGVKCFGDEFYSSSAGEVVLFPSLKELVLSEMASLEEWVSNNSCFPCLEKIEILNCPNLRITPTRFPSVTELILQEINERVAMPLITTNLHSLEIVQLVKITELRFLSHWLLKGKELKVFDCVDFEGFDQNEEEEEEKGFTSLKILWLICLPALKFVPDIQRFTSLETLKIEDCGSFKPLPEDLTCLSSCLENLRWAHVHNVKEIEDFEWDK